MKRMWLCPIKNRSWNVIKKYGLYGLSIGKKKAYDKIKIGDTLLVYVYRPVGKIVGICSVTSIPFMDYKPYWGYKKNGGIRYPCRIKLKICYNLVDDYGIIMPLYEVMGYYDEKKGINVEPYFGSNIMFYRINEEVLEDIKRKIESASLLNSIVGKKIDI